MELVVYIAVMSIVFGALASLTISGSRAVNNRDHIDDLYNSSVRISEQMRADVDQSTAVSVGVGTMTFTISGSPVAYSVVGGVLERDGVELSLPTIVVSDFVVAEYSTSPASSGIDVSMTLTHEDNSEESVFIHSSYARHE